VSINATFTLREIAVNTFTWSGVTTTTTTGWPHDCVPRISMTSFAVSQCDYHIQQPHKINMNEKAICLLWKWRATISIGLNGQYNLSFIFIYFHMLCRLFHVYFMLTLWNCMWLYFLDMDIEMSLPTTYIWIDWEFCICDFNCTSFSYVLYFTHEEYIQWREAVCSCCTFYSFLVLGFIPYSISME